MEDAIRTKKVLLNSERTVKELLTFVLDDNGKVKADEGQHDDLIMSLALAIFGLVKVITTTPGVFTKLISASINEPLHIISATSNLDKYFGGDYKKNKWVLE